MLYVFFSFLFLCINLYFSLALFFLFIGLDIIWIFLGFFLGCLGNLTYLLKVKECLKFINIEFLLLGYKIIPELHNYEYSCMLLLLVLTLSGSFLNQTLVIIFIVCLFLFIDMFANFFIILSRVTFPFFWRHPLEILLMKGFIADFSWNRKALFCVYFSNCLLGNTLKLTAIFFYLSICF